MDLPILAMQTPEPPTSFNASHQGSSHCVERGLDSSASRPGFSAAYTQHCAPAADAAYGRHAGRAMHILPLPPPTSVPPTPLGRRKEPVSSLAKLHPQFSPVRSEQSSYPSPPMSDSHSPSRRSAHLVEPDVPPYPQYSSDGRRLESYPPPPPPHYDHRTVTSSQGMPYQRPLYPGEAQRANPTQYTPAHAYDSPHYSNVQVAPGYQYGYPPPGVSPYYASQGHAPHGQPTPMIAPPPMRPSKPARRTKAHVASACVNCKKAHLSCDIQRPCGRCVANGKQDTCKDVQHKKRGRPRLRDDKEFARNEDGRVAPQLLGALPTSVNSQESFAQQPTFSSSHALRVLNAPDGASVARNQSLDQGFDPNQRRTYGGVSPSPYATERGSSQASLPIAFLNLDLIVLKSNQAFQDLLSFLGEVRLKSLIELLDPRSTEVVYQIRNELREEREEREPTYMAPITPLGQDPVEMVPESDVDRVSQMFTERFFLLNFKLPNGQHQSLKTQVRLAKTSVYFVTLVVLTPSRPAGPPLLTQQLAPPTPIGASQSQSAPTTAPVRDFAPYSMPPTSSGSAPTSPYFNFSSVRTSLPAISTSSYGSSSSYNYSPNVNAEQGYFPSSGPHAQSAPYPSPYPAVSRSGSIASETPNRLESVRETDRSSRLEGLQLPPIRSAPGPTDSPRGQGFNDAARERMRSLGSNAERPDTPDAGKRRRLNIQEVLE